MPAQGAEQGGGHAPAADLGLAAGAHAPAPLGDAPEPWELAERVNEMQHQLTYATMVRANYEKQLALPDLPATSCEFGFAPPLHLPAEAPAKKHKAK